MVWNAQNTPFRQADTMLVFELAWVDLSRRHCMDAAEMFIRVTELNDWQVELSHATRYFLAAGCYFSAERKDKDQESLDTVPSLAEKKGRGRVGGKPPPAEVLTFKKPEFYSIKWQLKAQRSIDIVKVIPVEEIAISLEYARTSPEVAKSLRPPPPDLSTHHDQDDTWDLLYFIWLSYMCLKSISWRFRGYHAQPAKRWNRTFGSEVEGLNGIVGMDAEDDPIVATRTLRFGGSRGISARLLAESAKSHGLQQALPMFQAA
ncbi:Mitochondrial outer membrane protein iml2 [Marasmius sp. AFHP31]|nr:Mitochondrial outer membrane protein iml2 [Marasmius sp. AFHP31]